MPDAVSLIAFWALAAVGAWTQTLTGFALGLIVMSGSTLLGLLPVPMTATIISVLVLVNGAMVLSRDWRHADRGLLAAAVVAALPTIALGLWLLHQLASGALSTLKVLLGVFIAGAALQLMRRAEPQRRRSGKAAFATAGALGGIMGGLFATSGPPVIWLIYRQPLPLDTIRVTLVSYFSVTQLWRLGLVAAGDGLNGATLIALSGAVPAIALGTWIARRFPPPVSALLLRRSALGLLFLSGIALVATGTMALRG